MKLIHERASGSEYQNAATQQYLHQLNKSLGLNYLYALLALTAIAFIYHTSVRVSNHIRLLASLGKRDGPHRYFSRASPWTRWLKNQLLLAPLFHQRRATQLKLGRFINLGGLPTRFQAIFVSLVVVYNVFASVYGIPWSSPDLEVLPIIRVRTGTLATVNLIPIVVMGTIKNPLINALDISYDSFNMMHRWTGRISILQALVHTVCWVIGKVRESGWPETLELLTHRELIATGLVATIGLVLIGFQSPKVIRALAYEFFLHLHIALAALTFAFLWLHLRGYPQQVLLLAAIIIWGSSRAWRFATMAYRSFGRERCYATVETLPGDAMRIEVISPRPWKAKPGQTLYLSIPSVGLWTSHPFSVAWNDYQTELSRSSSIQTNFDGEKHTNTISEMEVEQKGRNTMSLVVKKHDGFTSKLYNRAMANKQQSVTLSALIEGPYGHEKSLASYGTILLFASGVGITHQMPYIKELIQGYENETVAVKQITLVWVVPHVDCVEWIRPWMHEILAMEKRREVLRILLYVTKATLQEEIVSPSETVRMSRGRPDVLKIVSDAARDQMGCMGVSVCAGGGLADEVRRASRVAVGQGANLDLIEEGFGW